METWVEIARETMGASSCVTAISLSLQLILSFWPWPKPNFRFSVSRCCADVYVPWQPPQPRHHRGFQSCSPNGHYGVSQTNVRKILNHRSMCLLSVAWKLFTRTILSRIGRIVAKGEPRWQTVVVSLLSSNAFSSILGAGKENVQKLVGKSLQ